MKQGRFRRWLLRRADNHRQNLLWLLSGFGLFVTGLGLIVLAQYLLPDSLQRDLLALGGLILLGGGGILAAVGYLSLSLLRLYRFLNDDRNHD